MHLWFHLALAFFYIYTNTFTSHPSPAPALFWSSVVGGVLEEVADRVTWHPTLHTEVPGGRLGCLQEGVENVSVTVREPCCGMYACTARARCTTSLPSYQDLLGVFHY